jgi:photosystem II stability/assembly factor-like uncharacterized protein
VRDLEVAPSRPNTLYAAIRGGAVWRTIDGGAHWSSASNGLEFSSIYTTTALAVDPYNAQHVMAVTDFRLFETIDGGSNWSPAADLAVALTTVKFDPTDGQRLYVGGMGEVYASSDGGEHWTGHAVGEQSGVAALVVDPTAPNRLYASADCGIYESTDHGAIWTRMDLSGVCGLGPLAIDPHHPRRLFLGSDQGVASSTDGGGDWSWSAADGVSSITVDPADSAIYAGTAFGLLRSTDGGASWSDPPPSGMRDRVWTIAIAPGQPERLFVGTDEGVSVRSPGGAFTDINNGFPRVGVRAVAVDRRHPAIVYAGGYGLYRSTDDGRTWQRGSAPLGDCSVNEIVVDPTNSTDVYAATDGFCGVLRSTDGGVTWSAASRGLWIDGSHDRVTSLAIDPLRPSRLYVAILNSNPAGIIGRVYVSSDRGGTWSPTSLVAEYTSYVLAVAPGRHRTVYAGITCFGYGCPQTTFYRSTDGGAGWTAVSQTGGGGGSLAVSPLNARTVYDGGQVTNDGGRTWVNARDGIVGSVDTIVFDPIHPNTLYAGTDGGCCENGYGAFRTTDGAAHWSAFNDGLTNLDVRDLAVSSAGAALYAATAGGVFVCRFA